MNKNPNKIILYIFCVIIAFFSGCGRIKIDSDFANIKNKSKEITGSSAILNNFCDNDANEAIIQNQLISGISRDQAVSIALKNNPTLQADFQNLGIAKSDLAQAGLYTNPRIDSVFRAVTSEHAPGAGQTNIETVGAVHISDLWKVPLRKKVSEDELEMISQRILASILSIMANTKMAYNQCLSAQENLKNTKLLLNVTQAWRDEIYYRQAYGYTQDLDKDLADKILADVHVEFIQNRVNLSNSFIALRKILGLNPSSQSIKCTDILWVIRQLPSLDFLEEYALHNKPEMQMARIKVKRYKDAIALEKARIWDDVDLGIAFKQDFDKPFRGWGGSIGFSLPVFDTNYAQISREEFFLQQAKHEFRSVKLAILDEIREHYWLVNALKKEIKNYNKKIIPDLLAGIDYGYTYAATMQLPMTVPLETKRKLFEAKGTLIMLYNNYLHQYAELERAVGKTLGL